MKLPITINKRKRKLFETYLSEILPLSYQVDIMSNHIGEKSKYEIPYENEKQRKTIVSIAKILK